MIMVIMIAVVLITTCIVVSAAVVRNMMNKEYILTSDAMAATVAEIVDGDKVDDITHKVMEIYHSSGQKLDNTQTDDPRFAEYAGQFLPLMEDPAYLDVQVMLRKIQDNSEVDCAYILAINPNDKTAVYIVDGAYGDDIVTPGCFDMVEPSCYQYLSTPEQGFPAFISKTPEYGWMITSCAPIYNSRNEIAAFAAVDLDMNAVNNTQNSFLLTLTLILAALTVVICIIAILYAKQRIVKPINMLTAAAGQYGQKQDKTSDGNEFAKLNIHTGDEIEVLLHSMVKMETDIDNYIDSLTQTKAQLSSARQQATDMQRQAHMDSLTGIRNRNAYDKEIERLDAEIAQGLQSFGIAMIDLNFLKAINDTYGHECGNVAIISLSKLICDVFVHSPVFRIGGDEFAVILKNHDYFEVDDLIDEFKRRLDLRCSDSALEPWEKPSAAFGYSLFETKTDKSAEDVFKRADQNMYECKKTMKATRK